MLLVDGVVLAAKYRETAFVRRTPNLPRQRRSKNGMSRLVQKCLPVSMCLCVHDFLGLMMFSEPLVSKRTALASAPPRRSLIDHQPHIIKWNSMGEKVGRTQQNRPRGCVVRQPAARFGQQKDFEVCVCVSENAQQQKICDVYERTDGGVQ